MSGYEAAIETAVIPTTMRAMVRHRYGHAAEVIANEEVPVPEPGAGDVLVRVHATSVNAMEWHLMVGKPYVMRAVLGLTPRSPILGADVAGTVVAVGRDVETLGVGDRVFGAVGAGAYAEFAVGSQDHLVVKPANVGFAEAGVVGIAGLTALQGLRDVLMVGPGHRLLINGASGGVGTFAIQVGKALGAEVVAVCSTRNVDQAYLLGADHVVDYRKTDLSTIPARFDSFFDIAGTQSVRDSARILKPGGRYVMVGGAKGDWFGPLPRLVRAMAVFAVSDKKFGNFVATARRDDLLVLGDMLASGLVRPVIEDTFPLAEVGIPLGRQGAFHARAKTSILVGGGV